MAAGTLWLYLCALITALAGSRSAGTALFLESHDAKSLGAVYIVVALAITATLYLLAIIERRVSHERLATGTALILGVGAAVFALTAPADNGQHRLFYGALYVFVETAAVVGTLQFWTLSNTLFNWPQAHRWYPMVASGGIAGSLLGGSLARWVAPHSPIELLWLLVLSVPAVGAAILVVARCRARMGLPDANVPRAGGARSPSTEPGRPNVAGPKPGSGTAYAAARRQRRWHKLSTNLSRVVFMTVFTTTLTDFYFKFFADAHFAASPAGLTPFFGKYYMSVGLTTLLLQVVLTPLLLRRSGAFSGLSLMPVALLIGAVANLASPTLLLALLLKLIDSGFSHSVYRSCRELLFTPLPVELVGSFKTLSEGVAGRLGLLACGALLLAAAPLLHGWLVLCAIGASTLVWLFAVRRLRLAYRKELPEIWEGSAPVPARATAGRLDGAAVGR